MVHFSRLHPDQRCHPAGVGWDSSQRFCSAYNHRAAIGLQQDDEGEAENRPGPISTFLAHDAGFMVVEYEAEMRGIGCTIHIAWGQPKADWFDTNISISFEPSLGLADFRGTSFYMSGDEIHRLAKYVAEQMESGSEDSFPFVPTNLGFELLIFDADDAEASLQLFLNVGTVQANRVYTGSRVQVSCAELLAFGETLARVAQRIGISSQ